MLIEVFLAWCLAPVVLGYWYLPEYGGEGEDDEFKSEPNNLVSVSSLDLAINEYLKHKGEFTPAVLDDWPTTNQLVVDSTLHTNSPPSGDCPSSNGAHVEFFTLRTESEEGSESKNPFDSFNPRRTLPLVSVAEDTGEAAETFDTGKLVEQQSTETFAGQTSAVSHGLKEPVDLCERFNMHLYDSRTQSYIPARPNWRNNGPFCQEDDFEVIKKIGKGAQGKVYLADHKPSGTKVALKYLTSATDRHWFPFIRMEECLQDRLNGHPYITEHYCTFISRVRKPGLAVLALQLIEDPVDMWDFVYLKKWDNAASDFVHHFKYDEETVAQLAAQMISAMWYMHQMQVVYRDFKVENILLRPSGDISLLDFGVSSDPAKPCHLSHNRLLGTTYYFAPEYFKHGRPRYVAKEADWYALGISLYELAFRDGPFPQTPGISYEELTGYISKGFKCDTDEPKWASLCDLVNRLCDPDPRLRLGNIPGSYQTFLQHPFLRGTKIVNLMRDSELLVDKKRSKAAGSV